MPYLLRSLIAVLASSAALCHAENLQIAPQQRQQGLSTAMQVDAQGTLNFELQGQHWQVQGWPAGLPRQLGAQQVQSLFAQHPAGLPRQLGAQQVQSLFAQHPAGPVQALRLSEPRESHPWLEVVKSGRTGRQIAQGWTLHAINQQGIQIMDAQQKLHALSAGQSLKLKGSGCQKLHLLAVDIPAESAGTATEQEPRADWYLRTAPQC